VQRASRFAFQRDMAQIGKPVLNNRFAVATKTTPICGELGLQLHHQHHRHHGGHPAAAVLQAGR
jgi:hypothetical protein